MSLIQLNDVSIGYPQQTIAQHLYLTLEPSQVTCLLGANGCGKTTLLRSIMGVLKTLSGTILLDGKPQEQWTRKALAQFVGYVPQAYNHIFPFTAEEVVLMGRTAHIDWYSAPKAKDIDVAAQCLERLGVAHLRYQLFTRLSGGERQLVLIARALAQNPSLLIMDEPTASLDFGNQIRVLEHINQLKSKGLSILMTTHQPEHALRVADTVILFFQGEIIAQGAPRAVLTVEHLAQIYTLDPDIIRKNLHLVA